jgi:hypothetical protein
LRILAGKTVQQSGKIVTYDFLPSDLMHVRFESKHYYEQDSHNRWWVFEEDGIFGHLENFPFIPYASIKSSKISRIHPTKDTSQYVVTVTEVNGTEHKISLGTQMLVDIVIHSSLV